MPHAYQGMAHVAHIVGRRLSVVVVCESSLTVYLIGSYHKREDGTEYEVAALECLFLCEERGTWFCPYFCHYFSGEHDERI